MIKIYCTIQYNNRDLVHKLTSLEPGQNPNHQIIYRVSKIKPSIGLAKIRYHFSECQFRKISCVGGKTQ